MNYNYNHLYYFYIAAKSGGITIAADHLHISQPSLSSQLKVLEEYLEVKLFEKVGRKNQLTPTGQVLYSYCKQMFELSEKMSEVIFKSTPSAKRKIQIGVSDDVERKFASEVVSHFLNIFPKEERPQVTLTSGAMSQLIEHLRFREIDTIISSQEIINSEYVELEELKMPVVLCCSAQLEKIYPEIFSIQNNEELLLALSKTEEIQWILPAQQIELRSQIDSFIEKRSIAKKIVFESDSISALVKSVQNELGFSFLPLHHVSQEIRMNQIKRLGSSQGFWDYNLKIGCHLNNQNDLMIKAFSLAFNSTFKNMDFPFKHPFSFIDTQQVNA